MQVQTDIRPMFSYSFLIILFVIILIIIVFLIMRYLKKKEIKKDVIIPNHNELMNIKNKYLLKLDELEKKLKANGITSRRAYQELSSLIRNFIYEATNIKVTNYTLKEIGTLNMPVLYELVAEYYDPEFAVISKGNITASIDKTKVVIEKWN